MSADRTPRARTPPVGNKADQAAQEASLRKFQELAAKAKAKASATPACNEPLAQDMEEPAPVQDPQRVPPPLADLQALSVVAVPVVGREGRDDLVALQAQVREQEKAFSELRAAYLREQSEKKAALETMAAMERETLALAVDESLKLI